MVGRDFHFPLGESGPNRRRGLGRGSRDRFVGLEGPISDAIILRSSGILCVNEGPLREGMKAPAVLHGLGDVD